MTIHSNQNAYALFQDRIVASIYGDFFEANEVIIRNNSNRPCLLTRLSLTILPRDLPFSFFPQVFTNPGVTGIQELVYPSRVGLNNQTSEILCETELKLQSPLVSTVRSASPLDYWARAITAQNVPRDQLANRGLDILFSSYVHHRSLPTARRLRSVCSGVTTYILSSISSHTYNFPISNLTRKAQGLGPAPEPCRPAAHVPNPRVFWPWWGVRLHQLSALDGERLHSLMAVLRGCPHVYDCNQPPDHTLFPP